MAGQGAPVAAYSYLKAMDVITWIASIVVSNSGESSLRSSFVWHPPKLILILFFIAAGNKHKRITVVWRVRQMIKYISGGELGFSMIVKCGGIKF